MAVYRKAMTRKRVLRKAPKAGPFVKTTRAKKIPGKSVAKGGTVVIKAKGKKSMAFKKGGLHSQLGVPEGKPIPPGKKAAALAGKYGPLAKKRAVFAFKGALKAGRKTVAAKRKKKE